MAKFVYALANFIGKQVKNLPRIQTTINSTKTCSYPETSALLVGSHSLCQKLKVGHTCDKPSLPST